jgi:hypothetical protein
MRSSAGNVNSPISEASVAALSPPDTRILGWGLVGVALLAVALYWQTTGIGFLLDDLMLPSSVYKAFHGQPETLTRMMFFGGSVATDGLTCFRPGNWLSILFDYAIWGGNAFGYHITNIVCFALNCVLVGLVTNELAERFQIKQRSTTAVAAAALFACYPLHVESTAWVIGRVDVLCTMFYLAATHLFLRYLKLPTAGNAYGNGNMIGSVACFLASLSCKEMAVTLPVVFSILVLLLPVSTKQTLFKRLQPVGWIWLALIAFACVRTFMLGTVVGGYGSAFDRHVFRQSMRNFFDGASWWKVISPATDEYDVPQLLRYFAAAGTLAGAACAALAMLRNRRLMPIFAFLISWFIVALLPTFQIFHVFPNLVGSRLLFMSSAPLCMLLAVSFITAAETIKPPSISTSMAIGGLILLTATWVAVQRINIQPWLESGASMARAIKTIQEAAATGSDNGSAVLFANLPADHKGAGMIGRPEYLAQLLQPPLLVDKDWSNRIDTCERPLPGPSDFVFPNLLSQHIANARGAFFWDEESHGFVPLRQPSGHDSFSVEGGIPADQNATHWITKSTINPMAVQAVQVTFDKPATTLGSVTLVWSAKGRQWWQCVCSPVTAAGNTALFVPSRLRTWTYTDGIRSIGLQAAHGVNVISAHSIPINQVLPMITVAKNNVHVDAHSIEKCTSVQVYVAKPGQSFSDLATNTQPSASIIDYTGKVKGAVGDVTLPENLLAKGSVRTVCARAFDVNNQPLGVLSEVAAAHPAIK